MAYYDFFNFEHLVQLIIDIHDLHLKEINPTLCGMEENTPDNSWGPGFRSSYHIHFITAGKGVFENSYGRYELSAGQGFLFIPGERVFYQADSEDPWTYIWIGFQGSGMADISKRTGLSPSNPIFTYDKYFDIMTDFANIQYLKAGREYYCLSVLYKLFSSLCTDRNINADSIVEMAVNYILQTISDNVSVDSIAHKFDMDRRYFSRIFSAEMKMSPQQFIMHSKMNIALDMLKHKPYEVSIADIARSVGYSDPLAFSKAFKKYFNCSPTDIIKGKDPESREFINKFDSNPFRKR